MTRIVLSVLYLATFLVVSLALQPVATADRIIFKSASLNVEMMDQIKYTFFLIETNGKIVNTCELLKERFDQLYGDYKWSCIQGVEEYSVEDSPSAVFEYLPPGLGSYSFKGFYLGSDGSFKSAKKFLLLSSYKPKTPDPNPIAEEKPTTESDLKTFFFNSPYFLAVFFSIVSMFISWKLPREGEESSWADLARRLRTQHTNIQ